MLGTRLRAGITIEIRMRPRPMYAFRVILLMPRYAYAAYPTVLQLGVLVCVGLWIVYVAGMPILGQRTDVSSSSIPPSQNHRHHQSSQEEQAREACKRGAGDMAT